MPLTLRGRQGSITPKGPSGSYCLPAVEPQRLVAVHHDQRPEADGARFAVCVKCCNRRGEAAVATVGSAVLVYAYGGVLKPSSYQWVKETYRSRFAIETSYRQLHQWRIRTCTRDPLSLRLLYVAVALLLRNRSVRLAALGSVSARGVGADAVDLGPLSFRQMLRGAGCNTGPKRASVSVMRSIPNARCLLDLERVIMTATNGNY